MPPATPENPAGQVDINLELVNKQEVRDLVTAIGTLSSNVNAIREFGAEGANRAEQAQVMGFAQEQPHDITGSANTAFERLINAAGAGASLGGPEVSPSSGETSGRESSGEQTEQATVKMDELRQRARRSLADRAVYASLPNEYDRTLARAHGGADQRRRATPDDATLDSGEASSGASFGGPNDPPSAASPLYEHALYAQQTGPQMQMPRIGEFTIQNQLEMARDATLRMATWRRERGLRRLGPDATAEDMATLPEGAGMGNIAVGLGQAARYMPYLHQVGTQVLGMGSGSGVLGLNTNPNQLLAESEARGYSGAGATVQDVNIPGTKIGGGLLPDWMNFNLPGPFRMLATEAGREGIEREARKFMDRVRDPGFTGEEADAIERMMRDRGMDREDRDPFYSDTFRDSMARALGNRSPLNAADPDSLASLVQEATQHGQVGVREFVDSLESVPEAASAAGISLNEAIDQLNAMGEFFQNELGGTKAQGANFGQNWMASTATGPAIGQQLLGNPQVQGMLSINSGLLPQQFGMLPGGAMTGSIYETIGMMQDIFRGSTADVEQTINGEKFTIPGREGDDRLIASQLGIPVDMYKRLERGQREAERLAPLTSALDLREAQSHAARFDEQGHERGDADRRRRMNALAGGANKEDQIMSEGDLRQMMRKNRFSAGDIESVFEDKEGHKRPIREQNERIQRLMAKRTGSQRDRDMRRAGSRSTVKVDFTDQAKRWLKVAETRTQGDRDRGRADARSGKKLMNDLFARGSAPANERLIHRLRQFSEDDPLEPDDHESRGVGTGLFDGD